MVKTNPNVKLVPPDGGWGYAICCAAIIMLIPTSGFRPSFGMLYHDLWEDIGVGTTTIGLMIGGTMMISSITAFLTSSVLKVISIRQGALLAATLMNVGSIAIPFSNSSVTLFLSQTLVQSSGFGLMFNLSYTAIRGYFQERRLLAVSVVQTIIAIVIMCSPMIIKYATDYYGHRGMLIVVASIAMQQFVGVSLLQPVAWHMKKVEIPKEIVVEMTTLLPNNKSGDTEGTSTSGEIEKEKLPARATKNQNVIKSSPDSDKKSAMSRFLNHIIDLDLLKEFVVSTPNAAIGIAIFTSTIYTVMLPRALYAEGKTRSEVAWSMSLIAFGDLGMKISFILFSSLLKKVESRKLHLTGMILAWTARTGFQLTTNTAAKLVFLVLIGVGRCFLTVLLPILIADSVGPTKFSGAVGINGLTIGLLNLILGPVYGAIADFTGSYQVVFWICTATFFGIMLLWIIDITIRKRNQNKIEKA